MDYWNGQCINSSFSISLWQDETLLGWYRAKDLYPEGMLLYGMLDFLQDHSIVTVLIELKKHGEYTLHSQKALVNQQSDATELLWVNQNAELPGLLHIYRSPATSDPYTATAHHNIS